MIYGAGGTDTMSGGRDSAVLVFNSKENSRITISDFERSDMLLNLDGLGSHHFGSSDLVKEAGLLFQGWPVTPTPSGLPARRPFSFAPPPAALAKPAASNKKNAGTKPALSR